VSDDWGCCVDVPENVTGVCGCVSSVCRSHYDAVVAERDRYREALEEIAEVTSGDMQTQLCYWAAEALKPR